MTSEQTGERTGERIGELTGEQGTERPGTMTHPDLVSERDRLRMEQEAEFAATERMMFFSDAVVAIAVTLLALDLTVPDGDTARQILRNAGTHFSEYLAFVISFFVIAFHWRTHHRVFRYVNRVTARVITLNMYWLFLIVITPFITKLLSTGKTNLLRFGTYAAAETIQYALFVWMIVTIMRSDFVKPGTDLDHFRNTIRNIVPVGAGFALSIPTFVVLEHLGANPNAAFAAWFVFPTVFGFLGRYLRHRREAIAARTA